MTKAINKVEDFVIDTIDKVSSPSSRAGSTVERVAKMRKAKVDREVTALQMTKNSAKGQEYTTDDIKSYEKLYKDTETRVVITAEQTRSLIKDQVENDSEPEAFHPPLSQGI